MNCRRLQGSIRAAKALVVTAIALWLMPLLKAQTKQEGFHYMTSEEAFDPSHEGYVPSPDPTKTTKKVVLDAFYEEVFHAASNAVTQAMWEIDKQDKNAGVLLAHMIKDPPSTEHFLFHVKINELSANKPWWC